MRSSIIINARPYILMRPETEADFEAIIDLVLAVHQQEAATLSRVLDAYPSMRRDRWYAILDPEGKRVLSTLCLIPHVWTFGEGEVLVRLPVAEMGIVATAEDARGGGLCSWLIERYHEEARGQGYTLSGIEGIPVFYRRFGYEYALPLAVQLRLGPGLRPWDEAFAQKGFAPPPAQERPTGAFSFQKAGAGELSILAAYYREACEGLSIRSERDEATWAYLLGPAQESPATAVERYIIRKAPGEPIGYVGFGEDGFGPGLAIMEASLLSAEAARAALAFADGLRAERAKAHLTIAIEAGHPLAAEARSLGALDRWEYGWQMKCLDPLGFLRALSPIMERRLGASSWAGRAYRLDLGLYGLNISFDWDGLSLRVEGGVKGDSESTMSAELLCPLALGYRSLGELRHCRHELRVYGEAASFLETVFPQRASFIYPSY